ncbi:MULTISPECIES: FdtA/QdtA family cupin domain-containing protein [Fusobacterium]|uniref:sugar 3,4-ketoisomerase n=1 Tax=Fusobacterium TaxID=848 RepID=UPI001476E827|nr:MULTISPECIES: FdtA/QdtA family cupin domain-containing protein [Fusobacterium]NME35814.1 WxcM-like domain-containing protein [Fusobacterium sp. FSA-380-WT-3A]
MKKIKEIIIREIYSPGGSLSFFEKGKEFDFDIKRIYYIYKFSEQNRRGFHAHKELKQVMFCPHGKIEVEFTNGKIKEKYILDSPTKILVVEKGYWREFVSLEEGSILCVGASDIYDENDYIRDYNKYLEWEEKNNESTI